MARMVVDITGTSPNLYHSLLHQSHIEMQGTLLWKSGCGAIGRTTASMTHKVEKFPD